VELVAALLASPDREIDDVARDAKNLARAGYRDMSSAVWARVARMADGLASFAAEAAKSGCNASKNADKWDIARFAHACGVPSAYSKPMYRLVEDLSASTEPVHPLYCDVPRCVALYVMRMSFRWMPLERVKIGYGDRDLREVPQCHVGFSFSHLRRAPKKASVDWRANVRDRLNKYLQEHGVSDRPFWVKDFADAAKLIRQRELERRGFPTFMGEWFMHCEPAYMLENVERYASVAEALGEPIEKVFGRRYGDWCKALRVLLDKALDRLDGRTSGGIFGFPYMFSADDVRRAFAQVDRAIQILDSSDACSCEAHVVLGDEDEAKVVIGDVSHYLGGRACPP
jgi:hypothetical protein